MQTDRELLELAAKAAGLTHPDGWDWITNPLGHKWNPLDDDGDALRLAVKLDLLHTYHMDSPVWLLHFDATATDKAKATRRAFVCAAAAMAEQGALASA